MTGRQFYDWQTAGGADDVMRTRPRSTDGSARKRRLVDALERAELSWCAIGGVAVNHWATEPMVTRDVDFVVAVDQIELTVALLTEAGFTAERHDCFINFISKSQVALQLSTEAFYRDFPSRAVPADVHGILLRVASLEDTLSGKIKAWSDPDRRASKRIKDLSDIARLLEAHPQLHVSVPEKVRNALDVRL